jgi:hypothetical protein
MVWAHDVSLSPEMSHVELVSLTGIATNKQHYIRWYEHIIAANYRRCWVLSSTLSLAFILINYTASADMSTM